MQAEEQQTQSFLMPVERQAGADEQGGEAAAQTDVDNNHQFRSVALVFINLSGGKEKAAK